MVNTRHEVAKAKNWKEKPPGLDEFAKAVAKEPNLIRRPILIEGKKAIVGFDEEAYSAVG